MQGRAHDQLNVLLQPPRYTLQSSSTQELAECGAMAKEVIFMLSTMAFWESDLCHHPMRFGQRIQRYGLGMGSQQTRNLPAWLALVALSQAGIFTRMSFVPSSHYRWAF
jgi:hypothetical protein